MNYYALYHRAIGGGYTTGDVEFFPPLKGYYYLGQEMRTQGLSVKLTLDSKVKKLKADFFSVTCGAFFVSERMKAVLESCNIDLDFVPVETKYFKGKEVEKKYFLSMLTGRFPVLTMIGLSIREKQ